MSHIFISYSHKDKTYVHKLHHALVERGLDAWIDDHINYGPDWPDEIERRLQECSVFILVMSHEAKRSHWVQNELQTAIELNKPIFSLLLEGEVWWHLRTTLAVNVRDGELPPESFFMSLARHQSGAQRKTAPVETPKNEAPSVNIAGNVSGSTIFIGNQNDTGNEALPLPPTLGAGRETDAQQTHVQQTQSSNVEAQNSNAGDKSSNVGVKNPDIAVKSPDVGVKSSDVAVKSSDIGVKSSDVAVKSSNVAVQNSNTGVKSPDVAVQNPLGAGLPTRAQQTRAQQAQNPKIAEKSSKVEDKQRGPRRAPDRWLVAVIGLLFIYVIFELLILPNLLPKPASATHTPSATLSPTITLTPTLTPYPPEITQQGVDMLFIPAGSFTMGSDNGADDEKPPHSVSLSAFYMDKYEVTNALYKTCVDAGDCNAPAKSESYTRVNYYGNPQFDDYPVIYVSWNQATAYCAWRGARLPSEAEWEYAARGGDKRTYPWGEPIDESRANYGSEDKDTNKVGSYERGKSPLGVYDMAGNVWEWVNDWYDETYYQSSPESNPPGPVTGQTRVLRGGAWGSSEYGMRSAIRAQDAPGNRHNNFGIRCALSR